MAFQLRFAHVKNSLGDSVPEIATELVGKSPYSVSQFSSQRLLWQCRTCFNRFHATVHDRVNGTRCPYCAGKRVFPGKTDLATTHPELDKELFEFDGKTISKGSNKRVQWRCSKCWHVWKATVNARTSGKGCSMCCKRGFQNSIPGFVYLLKKEIFLKIGITNNPSHRVEKQHAKNGWELVDISSPMPGIFARRIETAVKTKLKYRKIPTGKSLHLKEFDGWTESWCAFDLNPVNISDLLDRLDIYPEEIEIHGDFFASRKVEANG